MTAGPPPLGLGIAAHHAATQTKVKSVTARNFQAGCLTLAIVLSHKDDVVTVSLPGGCVGKIRLVDLCDCEVKVKVDLAYFF